MDDTREEVVFGYEKKGLVYLRDMINYTEPPSMEGIYHINVPNTMCISVVWDAVPKSS